MTYSETLKDIFVQPEEVIQSCAFTNDLCLMVNVPVRLTDVFFIGVCFFGHLHSNTKYCFHYNVSYHVRSATSFSCVCYSREVSYQHIDIVVSLSVVVSLQMLIKPAERCSDLWCSGLTHSVVSVDGIHAPGS